MTHVYEALADELAAAGVRSAFGLMGEDTAGLVTDLSRVGIRYHGCAHENVAVGMADGYAWATGDVGIAILSRGPGLTNALTALITAVKAGRKVLVIAGEMATAAVSADLKRIDMARVMECAGVEYLCPRTADDAAPLLHEGLERAGAGACVLVAVPANLFASLTSAAHSSVVRSETPRADVASAPPLPSPSAAELDQVVSLLGEVERPLILVGRGGARIEDREVFTQLAERTGALLGTTLPARSLFRGHPRDVGIVGGFSTATTRRIVSEADCVLVFGASLSIFTRAHGDLIDGTRIARFDLDSEQTGRGLEAEAAVVCDAVAGARALLERLEGFPPTTGFGPEALDELAQPTIYEVDAGSGDGVDPRSLTVALDGILPDPRVVVTDGGHHVGFSTTAVAVHEPGHFRMSESFGSIGMGFGAAMGAAVGRPELPTVLFIGDGGLLMTLGDLTTLAHHGLPLIVIVMNDAAYGAEVHFLELEGLPGSGAALPAVDFAALARAAGIEAVSVASLEELDALPPLVSGRTTPLLVDCKLDPTIRAQWIEDIDAHRKRQYAAARG